MADDNVTKFAEALKSLIDVAPEMLKTMPHVALMADTNLRKVYGQLSFVSTGTVVPNSEPLKLEPIKTFMGRELNTPRKVTTEDLTPKQLEVKLFREAIERLRTSLPTLSNDQVVESYSKRDTNVLRGLAKQAGLENYRDGEINGQFVDDIRMGLEAQAELINKQAQDNALINKSTGSSTAEQSQ